MTLLTLVMAFTTQTARANYDWYDTSITIGGVTADFSKWSRGNGAPDTDLGILHDLTISSVELKIWDDSNDRGGVNMFFRLYGDNGQIGGDVDVWLGAATRITGDHDFSVSYTGPFDLADAFGVTLEAGKTYYLNMWAKSYGDAGDHWYNGDGDNYHAKLTIAPADQSVEVTSAGYATYVSSYPLDFTNARIKAYTAKVNTSNGKVELTQINKVPANEPVVLYKEGGDTENIPVCLTTTDTPAASDLVAGNGGTVATSEGNYYNYILNNVSGIGFYKANNQTVASNRAYLHTTYNVAAGARMAMVFADEATGITASSRETVSANRYFDLQGRRVAQPTKGLYIVNGKKTIIK